MIVTIERLGHLGDGVAPGPVYVPMALPGEVVEGAVANGRMEAPRIVTPSPERVKPPCPHYRSCGGCALMHASDDFVAGWKRDVVATALGAQGLSADMRPVQTSSPRSRRRATFSGRRTKKGATVGFHGRASGTIVEVTGCRLLDPALVALLPALSEITRVGASRKSELSLTATLTGGGVDLAVSGGKPLDQSLFSSLAPAAEGAGIARLTWGGELVINLRPAFQQFGRTSVIPPAGAFLQATAEGEAALVAAVREAVGPASRVADLFAGSGTFALPLAETAGVHAVEGESAMLSALDSGWRRGHDLHLLTTEPRDLFRRPLLPDELAGFEAVVIDPPRAGAEAQTVELARSNVPVIASVACNPVTFARDARILVDAGFHIDWLQVVDQFRWSPHVELIARFSR
ncbi:MAG: class I SAM-dependent RNA methyltransferase [Rhodobacteraceae bacterium]|nr:class I SAM-dependent RNA methyltransferase [Paracoccaceae bacterium]